ncbi:helix-turn-helix transcriptional regulator [Paramicrobacterium chengjingii]|uniref:helix-turn-helix transcriptional regulator n=1 Tax=Paramicrobacterium chengjingii TaxID=2769067 RepID=UPI001F30654D|nr:helix-turn-helix transcriptional regulator [Microbacterium chengjingii]
MNIGDVVLLGANVLCGSEPEGHITVTTVYVDTDYLLDQVFWQYIDVLHDRLDVSDFADRLYTDPAQILRLGEDRVGLLMPWLDELVALTVEGVNRERFHRMQALWFSIMDQISPLIRITPVRESPSQRGRTRPTLPRDRRFSPLRGEARMMREAMAADLARNWTLADVADLVHLSPKQCARVFTDAFGKTPLAYLTMLRVQEMAGLLRNTDLPVVQAARRVGWRSRSQASESFKDCTGVTPGRYRGLWRAGQWMAGNGTPVTG